MAPLAELTHHTSEPMVSGATREDADIHASSDEYAARFGDVIGQWMIKRQESALFDLVDGECTAVLDVGGGHGQIAIPLAQKNHSVTVVGSSPVCAHRLKPAIDSGMISFATANLIELPYKDQSFNLATSFRLMSHCAAWRTLVSELCRVSDHAVIIDYPVWFSVNALSPILFALKRKVEGNTRTFRVFSTRELAKEFRRHGFKLERSQKLFVWPMALHRIMRNVGISTKLEAPARWIGLTRLFGSPVVAKFVRES